MWMCKAALCVLVLIVSVPGVVFGSSIDNNDVYPPEDPQEPDIPIPPIPTQRPHPPQRPTHHQVHDLVLNPHQNSLCELKPIRQILTHAHCESREIGNHVCVGTCFSYTVPQTEPETPGDELLDYCDSCQASNSHWTPIELECEEDGNVYQVTKRVQMITNCSCSPCHPSSLPAQNNDVYPANDHQISELLVYKMLPEAAGLRRKLSLDELKKRITVDLTPEQLQELHGKVVFDIPSTYQDVSEDEDPRVINFKNLQ